jgi:predicted nucleotidyltransferase component of viral defense system
MPITNAQAQLIQDFVAESELALPEYALEKDFYVYEVIKALLALPPHPCFQLVFCGGTSLSKAYALIERMSEDVDFKVVPTETGAALGPSALRKQLGKFVEMIITHLTSLLAETDTIERQSRDSNRYTALRVNYDSVFERPESMRAHLLVELNFSPIIEPVVLLPVGLLLDRVIHGAYLSSVDLPTIGLPEALIEKLVSFPRRLALYLKRNPEPNFSAESGWDQALVRHLYDVYMMRTKAPEMELDQNKLQFIFSRIVNKDATEFFNQHPEFAQDPTQTLKAAMALARQSVDLRNQYNQFVSDMVYGRLEQQPSFDEALTQFEDLLSVSLKGI